MPHPIKKTYISDLLLDLSEIPIEKLTKPDLGKLALPVLDSVVDQLKRELETMRLVFDDSSEEMVDRALDSYRSYIKLLADIASTDGVTYASRRTEFGERLMREWDATRSVWPFFAAVSISRSGLVETATSAASQLEELAKKTRIELTAETDSLVASARSEAAKIESHARQTARGFSVKDAQDQFDAAARSLNTRAACWGVGALIFATWFLIFAFRIYFHPPMIMGASSNAVISSATVAYLLAIRITILGALGAVTTFCLRMLRAHLHMSAFNDHRRRVANSMAAFVEATENAEQRSVILTRLVDSVIVFGDSGLLEKDTETISAPSIAIDALTKNLGTRS